MIGFVSSCIEEIGIFDENIADLQAKNCIFRLYRDVRFSKNKLPFKKNMGAYLSREGKKSIYAGYYIHIEPGESFLAGGVWMPDADVLRAVRNEIYFNHAGFQKIIQHRDFKKSFGDLADERLKTNPRGFDKDHPAIELLRYKSYIASCKIADENLNNDKLVEQVASTFLTMKPLIDFLNQAIDMQE